MPLAKAVERFTYSDYVTWDDDERYELIDGIAYAMSPAPTTLHQRVLFGLGRQFADSLDNNDSPCALFLAPTDVRLNPDKADDTVVQPDLLVVCDERQVTIPCILGAPALVVEVLSPPSTERDTQIKFERYLRAGVPEYWVVDPERKMVYVHHLSNGNYVTWPYGANATIKSTVVPGCIADLLTVFE